VRKTGYRKASTLTLVMLVLLAGALLVGATFAERVELTGAVEKMQQGTDAFDYQVELSYYDKTAGDYRSLLEPEASFTQGMFWCPGRTEIAYLKVSNGEEFPVKVTLTMDAERVKDAQGKDVQDFGSTLSYAVLDQQEHDQPLAFASWDDLKASAKPLTIGKGHSVITIDPLGYATGSKHYVAIAIHMDENADNLYQNAQMNLKINMRVDSDQDPTQQ